MIVTVAAVAAHPPAAGRPPATDPALPAATSTCYLGYARWKRRPGSPETDAPLLRLDPRNGAKDVLHQVAFDDNTVPNITIGNIIWAGQLFDVVTYDRNDRTATNGTNLHDLLADPTVQGRQRGEAQLPAALKPGMRVDPDGPGDIVRTPTDDRLNLQCLHFPTPQTGLRAYSTGAPAAGESRAQLHRGSPLGRLSGVLTTVAGP